MNLFVSKSLSDKDRGLLEVINSLSESSVYSGGRKKLMKVVFLLEHLRDDLETLVPEEQFRKNSFTIFNFGVFSTDVMDSLSKLIELGLVEEKKKDFTYVMKITDKGLKNTGMLQCKDKERLEKIVNKFGKRTGKQLENETLGMLHLTKESKQQSMGVPVSSIIVGLGKA